MVVAVTVGVARVSVVVVSVASGDDSRSQPDVLGINGGGFSDSLDHTAVLDSIPCT